MEKIKIERVSFETTPEMPNGAEGAVVWTGFICSWHSLTKDAVWDGL